MHGVRCAFKLRREAMVDYMKVSQQSGAPTSAVNRRRQVAWILILIADLGFVAWGAMAGRIAGSSAWTRWHADLDRRLREGFSKGSWSELTSTSQWRPGTS